MDESSLGVRRLWSWTVLISTPSKRHLLRREVTDVAADDPRFGGCAYTSSDARTGRSADGDNLRRFMGLSGAVLDLSWATRLEEPAASRRIRKASVGELGIKPELRLASLLLPFAGVADDTAPARP